MFDITYVILRTLNWNPQVDVKDQTGEFQPIIIFSQNFSPIILVPILLVTSKFM